MYGSYGRKGFKRKAGSYKGRSSGAKKFRRSSNKRGFLRPQGEYWLLSAYKNHGAGGVPKGESANRPEIKVLKSLTPWPDRLEIKMKSTIAAIAGVSTGVGTEFVLKFNSCADPWGTAGATQPYGWDQIAPQYAAYTVFAAQIMVTIMPAVAGSTAYNCLSDVCVWPSLTGISLIGDPESCKQQPYGKFMTINTQVGGTIQAKIDNYASVMKVWGIKYSKVQDDDTFSGNAASAGDPTNLTYFHVMVQPANGSGTASSDDQYLSMEMIQYVHFWGRTTVAST